MRVVNPRHWWERRAFPACIVKQPRLLRHRSKPLSLIPTHQKLGAFGPGCVSISILGLLQHEGPKLVIILVARQATTWTAWIAVVLSIVPERCHLNFQALSSNISKKKNLPCYRSFGSVSCFVGIWSMGRNAGETHGPRSMNLPQRAKLLDALTDYNGWSRAPRSHQRPSKTPMVGEAGSRKLHNSEDYVVGQIPRTVRWIILVCRDSYGWPTFRRIPNAGGGWSAVINKKVSRFFSSDPITMGTLAVMKNRNIHAFNKSSNNFCWRLAPSRCQLEQ
jgi:hypothetical protein